MNNLNNISKTKTKTKLKLKFRLPLNNSSPDFYKVFLLKQELGPNILYVTLGIVSTFRF